MKKAERSILSRLLRIAAKLLGLAVLVGLSWALYVYHHNPFPTDEEMIAHFKRHRADIEELVRRYRTHRGPPGKHYLWAKVPENQALLEKAGVRRIFDTGPIWLPNPYSAETGRRVGKLLTEAPGFDLFARHGEINIDFTDMTSFAAWPKWGLVLKYLVYIPQLPRIENGWVMSPVNAKGESRPMDRVLDSLDDPPGDWVGCIYRQIDPQWFFRLCRS